MSQTIIEKVIDTAARNLTAAGCKFAIITPDGRTLGELTVDQPKKRRRVNSFVETGYQVRIAEMNVGDVEVFDAEGHDPESFRKVIIAHAGYCFGNGNATTRVEGGKIELMRLA